MKTQLLAGGLALALLAGCGSDADPKALPVLTTGAGADDAASLAAPESGASTADMRIGGRVEYRYDGDLPELDDEAAAWELAVEKIDTSEIEELAERLGADGDVERTEFGWHVEGDDGAQLDVQRSAGLPWNTYVASPDTAVSSPGVACPDDPEAREKCVVEEPKRPTDLPSKAEAEDIARELFEELGVDLDGATVRVDDGFSVWNVTADPELDGMPVIGMTTAVAVGPKGVVQFANGWLTEPDKGDDYPLIGTKAALEKLQDEQVTTMLGAPEPMIAEDCEGGPAVDCVIDPIPVPTEPTVVELTDVRLGLQLFGSWDGDEPAYLVPSYLFATEDGGELPVIAIEEEFLAPPPEPEPQPVPEPGGTGGGSSGSGGSSESCAGTASAAEPGADPGDAGSIEAGGPGQVAPGEVATFSVKASCGDTVVVDFGDGTPEDTVPMGEVSHRYEEAGGYEVSFRATACEASLTMTLTVGDQPTVTESETPVETEAPPRPGA